LGFNDYPMRSAEAIGKHWCLVFVASSLWHLTCLPAGPARTQGCALPQQLLVFVLDQLSQGVTVDHVFAQLFAKQQSMVPA
jgi:hypothetical protein